MARHVKYTYMYQYTVKLTTTPTVVANVDTKRRYMAMTLDSTKHGHLHWGNPNAGAAAHRGLILSALVSEEINASEVLEFTNAKMNLTSQAAYAWLSASGGNDLLHIVVGYDSADDVLAPPSADISSSSSSASSSSPSSSASSTSSVSASSTSSPSASSVSASSTSSVSASSNSSSSTSSYSSPSSSASSTSN